jgi:hypothetical protein
MLTVFAPFLYVHGQSPSDIEYRFVPSKIIEGTEGTLQVYAKDTMPRPVDNLIATSSDPTLVEITSIDSNQNRLFTEVKIRAMHAGNAKIAFAAPGFLSKEIPVTIYPDESVATQIIMKITPNIFSVNGPKEGYVSVQLANKDGIPVFASEDTIIDLNTDSDIINLKDSSLVVRKGEYFAVGQFEVKQSGEANLFASSEYAGMTSGKISANSKASELKIQSYVFPQIVNNYFASFAYLIVQLNDASGNPVIAKEDIPISVRVTDSTRDEPVNSSDREGDIRPVGHLVIKQGTYWAYIQLAVKAGLSGTYDISISAKGHLIPTAAQMQTTLTQTMDDKSARIDMLPILATGKEELVGVMHLEDVNGGPVISRDELIVRIDSSDPDAFSIDNVHMSRGDSVALVFGKAEKTDKPVTLNVITEDPQILNPVITLPEKEQLSLVVQPLIQKVLEDTVFPMAAYMTHSDGAPEYSTVDANITILPKESITTEQAVLQKGQAVALINSKMIKGEPTTLSFMAGRFSGTSSIDGISYEPSTVSLNYPEKIIKNTDNVFAVELLDGKNSPIFASKDLKIKLVSSDPNSINAPQDITIKKGSYYSLFDVIPSTAGNTKISVLINGMPLSEFSILSTALNPQIILLANDLANPGSAFTAKINAQYNDLPVSGLKVDWSAQGAVIQSVESTTDKDGAATILLTPLESGTIDLRATVSGGSFVDTTVSKGITINATQSIIQPVQEQNQFGSIMGLSPIYFGIPAATSAVVFVLKKKGLLDGITERISFVSKISEIKEKITQIRS